MEGESKLFLYGHQSCFPLSVQMMKEDAEITQLFPLIKQVRLARRSPILWHVSVSHLKKFTQRKMLELL